MLQVFYMNVAKVDRDVAYVSMVVHVCCKLLFPMFHLFFQKYVVSVFIWMLHMFYTYVVIVLSGCYVCLQWFQVFQTHVSGDSSDFSRMLQVLHLDVSKVDRLLHLPPRLLLPCLGAPPPPDTGWASDMMLRAGHAASPFEPETQAGAALSSSSQC
jgi:hypothetical protein